MNAITDKAEMYRLLAAGAFGNTIPQYFSVAEWRASGDDSRFQVWGVRTLTPGGPCRLNCPAGEVEATVAAFAPHRPNISLMVDRVAAVTLWADIWDSLSGLIVEGIEHPDTAAGWTWRNAMPDPARRRRWEGTAARMILRRHLDPNDLDDLAAVFDRWPGHVLELSAVDRFLGRVPHRRGIVWEVRAY